MKVTKISDIKKDFRFWSNIVIFLLFIALILSEITIFQREHIGPLYGENLMMGIGIIMTAIAWATVFSALHNKMSKWYLKEIIAILLIIVGIVLVPHVLTFVIGAVIIAFYGLLLYLKLTNKYGQSA